ncbi:MAG: NADP-dependent oxidoreductase [Actinomycetota bacterium]|nr:NADP-dependent oxidoreductase [Actinomycetota bacterium]
MPRAVRFERYGGVEVLDVVEVDTPEPGPGELLVRVRAAGINPFESKLRRGLFDAQIRLHFPAAQGNDLAGVVERVGAGVSAFAIGDEVLGTSVRRGSQAELALASETKLLRRPPALPWEVAGGLWTVATTAAAAVGAVTVAAGDVVVVAGASGGVGSLAAQLARERGAAVVGVASERSHAWLRSHGITPVAHGDGLRQRLAAALAQAAADGHPSALIDTAGHGYVELGVELGIDPRRVNTIVESDAALRLGARAQGQPSGAGPDDAREIVALLAAGRLELPIAAVFPLAQVRDAYALLDGGHPPGKIVLVP